MKIRLLWLLIILVTLGLTTCSMDYIKDLTTPQVRKACEQNSMEGCTELGRREYRAQKYVAAQKLWQRSCDGGDMAGCCSLGGLYWSGKGPPRDLKKSAQLLKQACDGRDVTCCDSLGLLYATEDIEGKDKSDARPLFEKACAGKHPRGCYNMGILHSKGEGGATQDLLKTADYYKRACDADFRMACHNLGLMYQFGQGVSKDEFKAMKLFGKACYYHNKEACRRETTMRHVTQCRTACARGDALLQQYHGALGDAGLSGDVTETLKWTEKMQPYCFERCMGDKVDVQCMNKAQTVMDLALCDPPQEGKAP